MRNLSWRFKYAIYCAFLFPVIAHVNFICTGFLKGLNRIFIPIILGGTAGFLIGLMKDRWMRINTNLEQLVKEKTNDLNEKIQELETANSTILEISRKDPLTNLANRRFFYERAEELYSLSRRHSKDLSLIMSDIDNFKSVNDNYGHDMGDTVLKKFADTMKECSRSEDLAAHK